jgi:YVTN family beta-propeller protein
LEEAKHLDPEADPTRRTASRTRLVVTAVTIVVAALGAVIVFMRAGKDNVTTENITATLRVDGKPNGLAAAPDALWVALNQRVGSFDAKLERLNLTTGTVEASVPLTGVLTQSRKIGASLWQVRHDDWFNRKPGELVELDWGTGRIEGRIPFDRPPFGFAEGNGSLWVVVGHDPATLVRIDLSTRKAVGTPVTISPKLVGELEYGNGEVWATAFEEGMLIRFDPASGRIDKVRVGDFPAGIAIVDGSVWVANRESGTVSRVDAETMRVLGTVGVGKHPAFLSAAGGSIWVSNQADGTVTRIDQRTGKVVGAPIKIARPADDPAAHVQTVERGSLWVASSSEDTVSRIDTSKKP